LLISFKNCTVSFQDEILFDPAWGVYDMAVGKKIVSAFAGPADPNSFENTSKLSETKTHKLSYTDQEKALYKLYDQLRDYRANDLGGEKQLTAIFDTLKQVYPKDWLLPLELYELSKLRGYALENKLKDNLEKLAEQNEYKTLIVNGLSLCER